MLICIMGMMLGPLMLLTPHVHLEAAEERYFAETASPAMHLFFSPILSLNTVSG